MGENIDESLYSRQLYVLGYEAMERMLKSTVLIRGMNGLGQEVAKNVCLAGVKKVYINDPTVVSVQDLCTGFYLTEEDVGLRRDTAVLKKLRSLNTYVQVEVVEDVRSYSEYSCIVACGLSIGEQVALDNACREKGICFVGCQERGVFSQVFCDFGEEFLVIDPTGEVQAMGVINDIDDNGVLTTIEGERHNLEDGDLIKITENKSYEGQMFEVKVVSPYKLQLRRIRDMSMLQEENSSKMANTSRMSFVVSQGGYFEQQKKTQVLSFKRLEDLLESPTIMNFDYSDTERALAIHRCFVLLDEFKRRHGRMPQPRNDVDAEAFCDMFEKTFGKSKYADLVRLFSQQPPGSLVPICSIIGGFVAQEVLKACSGKFHPLFQFMYFDSVQCLPNETGNDFSRENSRYDPLIELLGKKNVEKIFNARVFVVGAGAIGCEHLKNFAMLGLGSKGVVYITDMDSIEQSNLNRQFLFGPSDVSKMKSEVAARELKRLNPDVNVVSFNLKVGHETENVFGDRFYRGIDFVANALDNVESRLYIDERCVFNKKAMFETGTLGTKGNSQVVLPDMTESYASSRDPPEKSIPLCTIRNFPNLIEHTIEWALNEFRTVFHDNIISISDHLSAPPSERDNEDAQRLLESAPTSAEQCVEKAAYLFKRYFYDSINSLLESFPPDAVTQENIPFWTPPKRPPASIAFDINDPLHVLFILSASNLYAYCYGVPHKITKATALDVIREKTKVGTFEEEVVDLATHPSSLPRLYPVEFEKDNDLNHHVDFIYACANLRANNYKIQNASRHTVKGIAGRIIPAIATTTALISGISVLEMMKFIFSSALDNYKNAFVNLALPYLATSTPIPPTKSEYYFKEGERVSFTIWDRFEMEDQRLEDLIAHFKEKHQAVITMMMVDGALVYMDTDKKTQSNLSKYVSELSKSEMNAVVDVVFENTECESFPPIVVDVSQKSK